MSILSTSVRSLAVASWLGGALAAQCQFSSLTQQATGAFCNIGPVGCCMVPGMPTQLGPALDTSRCTVDFTVRAIEGCCGVTIPLRLLAIGTTPAAIPLPQFGNTCTLWLVPSDVFAFTGPMLSIAIPPTLPPLTFVAQAAAVIVDPFAAPAGMVTLTGAAAITLQ